MSVESSSEVKEPAGNPQPALSTHKSSIIVADYSLFFEFVVYLDSLLPCSLICRDGSPLSWRRAKEPGPTLGTQFERVKIPAIARKSWRSIVIHWSILCLNDVFVVIFTLLCTLPCFVHVKVLQAASVELAHPVVNSATSTVEPEPTTKSLTAIAQEVRAVLQAHATIQEIAIGLSTLVVLSSQAATSLPMADQVSAEGVSVYLGVQRPG